MNATSEPANHTTRARRGLRWGLVLLSLVTVASLSVAIVAVVQASRAVGTLRRMNEEITLRDPAGRPRVRLRSAKDGGSIELLDGSGMARVALRFVKEDFATITMQRKDDSTLDLTVSPFHSGIDLRNPETGSSLGLEARSFTLKRGASKASMRVNDGDAHVELLSGHGQLGIHVSEDETVTLVDGDFHFHGDDGLYFGTSTKPISDENAHEKPR